MFIKLFLIITLMPMIISDLRYRNISALWLSAFILSAICIRCYKCEIYSTIISVGINILIISFIVLGTLLYFIARYAPKQKCFFNCIGLGDILFLFSITLLFEPATFLIFLILSLIFSLIWYYVIIILFGKYLTIPLVATIGIFYIFYLLIKLTVYGL